MKLELPGRWFQVPRNPARLAQGPDSWQRKSQQMIRHPRGMYTFIWMQDLPIFARDPSQLLYRALQRLPIVRPDFRGEFFLLPVSSGFRETSRPVNLWVNAVGIQEFPADGPI